MKNLIFIVLLGFVLSLVSCNLFGKKEKKDKDGVKAQVNTEAEAPAAVAAETADVTYHVWATDDYGSLFVITAVYTTAAGEEREVITALPWKKTIKGVTLPFGAKMKVELAANTDYPEKDTYTVGLSTDISYITSKGRFKGSLIPQSDHIGIKKNQVASYHERELKRAHSTELTIDAAK